MYTIKDILFLRSKILDFEKKKRKKNRKFTDFLFDAFFSIAMFYQNWS